MVLFQLYLLLLAHSVVSLSDFEAIQRQSTLDSNSIPWTQLHDDDSTSPTMPLTARLNINLPVNSKVLLLSVTSFGLANRLRVIASAAQIAEASNRRLFFDWVPSDACGASWLDLFQAPSTRWATLFDGDRELLRSLESLVNWSTPLAFASTSSSSSSSIPSEQQRVLVWRPRGAVLSPEALLNMASDVVVVKAGGLAVLRSSSCQGYYWRKRGFYRDLLQNLNPSVKSWVDAFLESPDIWGGGGSKRMSEGGVLVVGLHVRVHDPVHDWPVVPPQPGSPQPKGRGGREGETGNDDDDDDATAGASAVGGDGGASTGAAVTGGGGGGGAVAALKFEDVAPLASFEQAIRELIAHLPEVKFFLASNSEAVKASLVNTFGAARIVTIDNGHYAASSSSSSSSSSSVGAGEGNNSCSSNNSLFSDRLRSDSVQRGLLDFVLLSHCALIVHGFGSSFAEEAAIPNLTPSVRLRSGGHLLGPDLSFPFCNNPVIENGVNLFDEAMAAILPAGSSPEPDGGGRSRCFRDESSLLERGEVCTRFATRSPCMSFQRAWGMSNVYC